MKNYSRRRFIQTGVTGLVGLSVLPMLSSCKTSVNDTIRLGFIGLGQQTRYLVDGFAELTGVKIVAGCDVYEVKRQRFELQVKAMQEALEQTPEVTTYEDYQEILSRDDIDAVVIVTPDHWHAIQTLDACRAGKDIYLEKPVTFTIKEGIAIVSAVRSNNIVLAVGSQQRSDPNFQHAVKMVHEGKLGKLTKINAWVGPPPIPYNLPEENLPAGLNWEKWLGPNPYVHYNNRLNPPIGISPKQNETFWAEWRYFKETGGGFLTDWGAHNFDIAQWALKKDNSGPVEIVPVGTRDNDYIHYYYEDGLLMANEPFTEDERFGVKFSSDDAWIQVFRGRYEASDDSLMPPVTDETGTGIRYETGTAHLEDFLNAVRSRKDPIANVEAGHRTGSVGILGNIATQLQRPLRWDPAAERFVNEPQADALLHRQYRDGYSLT